MNRSVVKMLSKLAVAVLLALGGAATAGETPPTNIKASYRVYRAGIWIGVVEEHFTREREQYKIVSTTDTVGPLRLFLRDQLTMVSEGTVGAGGLKPASYRFSRTKDQDKNIAAVFAWDKAELHSQHDHEVEVFALPVGTQDRISAMYQFMFKPPVADEVNIWMTQGKKAERYHYKKVGEPVLTVIDDDIPTIYFAREVKAGETRAHLWLAKDKFYLPVKIRFEDGKGGAFEQVLVALHTE